MNGSSGEFQEKDSHSKNAMWLERLEEFGGYRVDWEKIGISNYVDGAAMHFGRLDAWKGCVVATIDSEVERDRQRQTLLSVRYGRYLRLAISNIQKVV